MKRFRSDESSQKRGFGQRINAWLAEPAGETFRHGKWRFWFPTLIGLTALNAVMTAVIFGQDGAQKYIGSIVVLAGAVLCWLALGLLHYSDSNDRTLALCVAILDSITLLFVAAHFSFLLWAQGHLWILRAAEGAYRQDLATHNAQWAPVKESNDRIAATVERIAGIEKETERLRNDTAYWARRNKVQPSKSEIKFEASLTPMEVPPPPKTPEESSAGFLATWDWWIRIAGFGELALSIITLIFVRTRTAMTNARQPEDFPSEIDVDVTERRSSRRGDLILNTTTHDDRIDDTRSDRKTTQGKNTPGLRELRECLKLIAFEHPPGHYKADVRDDYVIIRAMASDRGDQHTVHSTKASLSLLNDALTMQPDTFRKRLEAFLRKRKFEL